MVKRDQEGNAPQLELGLVNTSAPPFDRSECPTERPCTKYSCRYNNHIDTERAGRPNHGFAPAAKLLPIAVRERVESCALDVAERGAQTTAQVAKQINTTQRRVQQIENRALNKVGVAVMLEAVLDEHLRSKLPRGAKLEAVYPANRDDTGRMYVMVVFDVRSIPPGKGVGNVLASAMRGEP